MASQLDPAALLQRVLLLERNQGFQDRAAVGGIAVFARSQLQRADGAAGSRLRAAVQILEPYAEADRRQREAAVSGALEALLTGRSQAPRARFSKRDSVARTNAVVPPSVPAVVHTPEDLEGPISGVKGIGKASERAMAAVGVRSVRDLVYYFPRIHYDYTDTRSISRMRLGQKTTLVGTITDVRVNRFPRKSRYGSGGGRRDLTIVTAAVSDDTGTVAVRWFNQPYLADKLPVGSRVAITGEPDVSNGRLVFQPRDYELIETEELKHTARLVPVYPLTKGLYQRSLRQLIHRVLGEYLPAVADYLPVGLRESLRLPALSQAIGAYHFPADEEQKEWAQTRLAFDELLLIQLGLLLRKQRLQAPLPDVAIERDAELLRRFCASLPFDLTRAQQRVIDHILADMSRPAPMNRLLQGDVGSGKTVVAAAALLQAQRSGRQGMMMAPTEILAEQHHRTLSTLLAAFDIRCELLIGSTPKRRRNEILAGVLAGEVDVLVGTHALIQEGVELARLGLAITDEQHRFGVEQRSTLRQKGLHPHTLAMTATPIPRTLAMTIYGDLDVSAIDEMPPGRLPVITTWCRTPREAYGVVRDEVCEGRQAFVICPVIEDSMESDMRSVLAEHKELQSVVFPDLRVGLLHGRMKSRDKEAMLAAFRAGEYHVLVATSVVEVGIDIPNATVMLIRDAHRFGLAQLHQFRGRVGRGGDQAFCVLLSDTQGDEARERLEALTATENGFELAEEDLRLRGPGEFWGTRQSGLPELRVATLGDLPTVELARQAALDILEDDPNLSSPQHEPLRRQVQRFWSDAADLS